MIIKYYILILLNLRCFKKEATESEFHLDKEILRDSLENNNSLNSIINNSDDKSSDKISDIFINEDKKSKDLNEIYMKTRM